MSLPEDLKGKKTVDLKSFNYALKITIFVEYVKFGPISWKFDILSIIAKLKFVSKNTFAHMWQV